MTITEHRLQQIADNEREVCKNWQLNLVKGLKRRQDAAEAALVVHVGYARHYGAKWGEIAKALRMNKGEVKRKYG